METNMTAINIFQKSCNYIYEDKNIDLITIVEETNIVLKEKERIPFNTRIRRIFSSFTQ